MAAVLLFVALAPGLFLIWYFWHRDRYEPEPKKKIIVIFLLGGAAILPAMVLELALEAGVRAVSAGLFRCFLTSFFVIAPVEEMLKFFVVKKWAYNSREFDEVMDGIVYTVSASLGFATFENIVYVISYGLGTGILRAFLAVPGHAFYGAVMGSYIGWAKFSGGKAGKLILIGILLAVGFHGLYDFLLLTETLLALLVMPLIVGLGFIVRREIRRAELQSRSRLEAAPAQPTGTPPAAKPAS